MLSIRTGKLFALLSSGLLGLLFAAPNCVAGSVRLAWDAGPEQSVAGYHVYRSTRSGEGFSRITSVPVRRPWYTDSSAASGKTYYYAVTALSKSSLESGLSEEVVAQVPRNEPPVARADLWATFINTEARIPVLENDEDPNRDRLSVVGVVGAGDGQISLDGDKSIKYSPASGFLGVDSFRYIVFDGESSSSWAEVLIAVRLPGDINGNGKVESDDVSAIAFSVKSPANGPADPRDLDQDGVVTILDLQEAYSRCENCVE